MKGYIKIIIFIIYCGYYINCLCIQGNNCPNGQGVCVGNKCVCTKNFWTLKNNQQSNSFIYCNYERYSRFYLLLFEFFIPTSGHFIAGKYYLATFKLILLIIPLLSCIFGYISFFNDGYQKIKNKKLDLSEGDSEQVEQNDNNLHLANREEKNVDFSIYLPVVITFISLSLFFIIHTIDIICYLFAIYNDGYGVPLL